MVTYTSCDTQFKEKRSNDNNGFQSRTIGKNTLNTFLFACERLKAPFGEHVRFVVCQEQNILKGYVTAPSGNLLFSDVKLKPRKDGVLKTLHDTTLPFASIFHMCSQWVF